MAGRYACTACRDHSAGGNGACTPAMEIYRGICHIAKEGTFCLENEEPYTLADRPVSLNFETQNCENKLFFTYFAK